MFYYIVLVIPALIFAMWAQAQVSSTFAKYDKMHSRRHLTGERTARSILDANGLQNVAIERVSGKLTDHYDPTSRTLRLSDSTYQSDSVAAVGVAAHECGHAVQHARGYMPMSIRSAIIPITNFGAKISMPLIILGVIMNYGPLVKVGLILFSFAAIFQLVTLPVEFNASSRALTTLEQQNYLEPEELDGSRKVLRAAALTYVAALLVTVAQLLQLFLRYRGRRD